MTARAYEYCHIVSFEETNLVGNVYYANHVRWQGRCREMFLKHHAPGVLELLHNGLALATVRVSCEYFEELFALDEVLIKMFATELSDSRITMRFDYERRRCGHLELVARGEQQVACLQREGATSKATRVPVELRAALRAFMA